jgi:hypothetical protein
LNKNIGDWKVTSASWERVGEGVKTVSVSGFTSQGEYGELTLQAVFPVPVVDSTPAI